MARPEASSTAHGRTFTRCPQGQLHTVRSKTIANPTRHARHEVLRQCVLLRPGPRDIKLREVLFHQLQDRRHLGLRAQSVMNDQRGATSGRDLFLSHMSSTCDLERCGYAYVLHVFCCWSWCLQHPSTTTSAIVKSSDARIWDGQEPLQQKHANTMWARSCGTNSTDSKRQS